MESHMIPSEVRFVTRLPCSQRGKVGRFNLRARALQQMAKAGTDMTGTPNDDPISFEDFQDIIARVLQVEREKVVPEASFVEDLLADSIQLVEMMLRMEEMGISIPIESAWEIETVGDAYKLYGQYTVPS
jgi:acyl carrier protein